MMFRRVCLAMIVMVSGIFVVKADDKIFERDLSSPFLRDRDDKFLRDLDLPGPLRKSWPYAELPERRFKAVEARRACHARASFEIRKVGATSQRVLGRLQSDRAGDLRFRVEGRYLFSLDGDLKTFTAHCLVSSRRVLSFEFSE